MFSSLESNSQSFSSYFQSDTSDSSGSMAGLTPKKTTSASSSLHNTTEEMKTALKKDLDGHVYDQVSVAEFVEHVWKLDQETLKKISDANFQLCQEPLAKYRQVLTLGGKFSEPELHQPFHEMVRGLLKDVCDHLSIDHSMLTTYFWDACGRAILRSKSANDTEERIRKPDLLEVYIPMPEDGQPALIPTWHEVHASAEFKKKKLEEEPLPASDLASIPEEDQSMPTTGTGAGPKARTTRRRARTTASSDSNVDSSDSARTGSKRSASSLSSDNRPTKKARAKINVSQDELQLATYALECLHVGNRHYVTGIFIDGFSIKLWYYDRTAAMCTGFFDFGTASGTTDLALTLFALSQCNMQQAGFDPHLHRITLPEAGQFIQPSFIVPLARPEEDVTKLCYRFPSLAPQNDCIFTAQEILAQYKGITGRGTTAIAGKLGCVEGALSERLYVLKMSWQYITRKHEGDIVRQLRDALPGWTDHLPDPVFHTKLTGTELGLPTRSIREILEKDGRTSISGKNDRDLHVIVTNRYKNIWKAKDVEEFKRIFLDCVECHYHAYHTGRVLHRDVSENNLMIYQPGITDKDSVDSDKDSDKKDSNKKDSDNATGHPSFGSPPTRGILNDFDMAAVLNSDGGIDSDRGPHHHLTGTLPFMARDLLLPQAYRSNDSLDSSIAHFYRYDLESFYYILIWAATHYNLKTGRRVGPKTGEKSHLEQWNKNEDGDTQEAYYAKNSLYSGIYLKPIIVDVRKEWQGLWDKWIEPLSRMFRKGFHAQDMAREDKEADFDYATCGGHITFEKFMLAIGETPRGLNPITTA
ncbi:hypothetical protein CVT25_006612 [Psilocybe cyanescens]|uniref:Fungal-type protein kinase domain-containing protein n=1 Tax=Psilocybe cyanescens TaxID=93625 RepID=A0A409XIQ0_PSICY|nr:hypothetical protein CVT25_006612 [Psilocybe cyanescens]